MRFTKDGKTVEVVLSCRDFAYAEYNANDESQSERSCFIGVSSGQRLQIHLRHVGYWAEAKSDIVVEGKIRRCVQHRNVSHLETMVKYVDQVWGEHDKKNTMGFADLEFADTPQQSLATLATPQTSLPSQLPTSAQRGSLVIMVYDPQGQGWKHKPPFPTFFDSNQASAPPSVASSPTEPTTSHDDITFTHELCVKPVNRASKHGIPSSLRDRGRSSNRPWAIFTFHYRDEGLLKLMKMQGAVTCSWATTTGFADDRMSNRMLWSQMRLDNLKDYDTLANCIPVSRRKALQSPSTDVNTEFLRRRGAGEGYDPGSFYAPGGAYFREQQMEEGKSESPQAGAYTAVLGPAQRKRPRLTECETSLDSDEIPPGYLHQQLDVNSISPLSKRVRFSVSKTPPEEDELHRENQENHARPANYTRRAISNPPIAQDSIVRCSHLDRKLSAPFKASATSFTRLEIPETPPASPLSCPKSTVASIDRSSRDSDPGYFTRDPRIHSSNLFTTTLRVQDKPPTADPRLRREFVDVPGEVYAGRLTVITMPGRIVYNEEYASNTKLMSLERLIELQKVTELVYIAEHEDRMKEVEKEKEAWERARAKRKKEQGRFS